MDEDEQTSVQPYHPDVFDQLNLFRTAKTLLSHNKGYIRSLGDVIVDHKLHTIWSAPLMVDSFRRRF